MKKGQAAMEFLMTYGWAILVVIAAIAALAYFGVLDPARLLPERCQFPAGMDCIDKANILAETVAGNDGTIEVALRNNVGFPVNVGSADSAITCTGPNEIAVGATGPGGYAAIANDSVSNNEVFRIRLVGCTTGAAGDKVDGTVTVTYINSETGLQHDVIGEVRGRAA